MPNSEKIEKLKEKIKEIDEEIEGFESEIDTLNMKKASLEKELEVLQRLNKEGKEFIEPSPGQLQLSVL